MEVNEKKFNLLHKTLAAIKILMAVQTLITIILGIVISYKLIKNIQMEYMYGVAFLICLSTTLIILIVFCCFKKYCYDYEVDMDTQFINELMAEKAKEKHQNEDDEANN